MPLPTADAPAGCVESVGLLVAGLDSELREEILQLVATAGLRVRAVEPSQLDEATWSAADLVLVDAASADQVRGAGLARRSAVLLVASSPPEVDILAAALGIGVEQVLELPHSRPLLLDRLCEVASGSGPLGVAVAVLGGCGGVGASTLAVALALSAAQAGQQPVLLGADPWDGGIDVALAAEDVPGPRWPDFAGVSGRLSSAAILDGLPQAHGVRFLSSARRQPSRIPLQALSAVLAAARRTGEPVIVDLPRGVGEAAHWLGGVVDLSVVVCPATVAGALSTRAVVAELGWTAPTSGIAVRDAAGREIDDVTLEGAVGLPVVTSVPEDPHLFRRRGWGDPPQLRRRGRLAKSCSRLWRLAAQGRRDAGLNAG